MKNSFKLASIFTDHMVLQRDAVIPVWGTAQDGETIGIEFLGAAYETKAHEGKWHLHLSPVNAGGPYEMKVTNGDGEHILKDILVGEVWVAGGQSNMQMTLNESLNGRAEAALADDGNIRYYDVPRIAAEEDAETAAQQEASWRSCTPETAGLFSAVAYYFAKKLSKSLDIPIGIIGCNMGGTSASCWMSEKYLASDEDTKAYLDEYNDYISKHSEEECAIQTEEFNRRFEEYLKKADVYKAAHPAAGETEMSRNAGDVPWPPPMSKKSFLRPSGLYHNMVRKIAPYGIKGVIFYQGESDEHKAGSYGKLFRKMMENWRDDWNNPSLPFLFTQITYYGRGEDPENNVETKGEEWAVTREQQLLTSMQDPHTAMAVITDCGEKDNIHPLDKCTVGQRLALLAEAKIYGLDVPCQGPAYREMRISGDTATLYFDHAEKGLTAKGEELKGFKVCGEDKRFVTANARIKGNTVEVSGEGIEAPVAVRYGFANYSCANLFNMDGLPASPFRTDHL